MFLNHVLRGAALVRLSVSLYRDSFNDGGYTLSWCKTWHMLGITLIGVEVHQQVLHFELGGLIVLACLTSCGGSNQS